MLVHRFWSKVDKYGPNGCWNWTASTHQRGYGSFHFDGRSRPAHRLSYSWAKGAIPAGLQIHHTCENKRCVNPAHLIAISAGAHTLIGNSWSGKNSRKTHCPQGHPLSGNNLHTRKNGRRRCRMCDRQRSRDYQLTSPSFKIWKNAWQRNYRRKKKEQREMFNSSKRDGSQQTSNLSKGGA